MKKIALILYYVSVVALTYTATNRVLDYKQKTLSTIDNASAEIETLQELADRKRFVIPQLITNLANVDGRYIRVGTHPLFEDIIKQSEPRIKDIPASMYYKDKDFPGSYPAGATDLVPEQN